MQFALVIWKLVPVTIGTFGDDLPFFQESLEKEADLELLKLGVVDADGDVLEIDEDGDLALAHPVGRGIAVIVVVAVEVRFAWHARSLTRI